MLDDPKRLADTRSWLTKAGTDLRSAEHALTARPPLTGDATFHCQQLAEKALKAFLTWHDRPFRRTHDLTMVGAQCIAVDPTLATVCRDAERLTIFAWVFRYPGEPEEPSRQEATEALDLARDVYHAVLARLPGDVAPAVSPDHS